MTRDRITLTALQSLWARMAVEPPDSTMLIGWSESLGFRVPSASVWHVVETATAGIIVSVIAYLLASRRLKTSRWHERQGETYGQMLKDLRILAKTSEDISKAEDEEYETRPTFSPTDVRLRRRAQREAYNRLRAAFDENRYLLSRSAQHTLSEVIHGIEDPANDDVTRMDLVYRYHSRIAHERFLEDLLVDVGTGIGVGRSLRRSRRWVLRRWYITKSRASTLKWQISRKLEEWWLALTSHLTQESVRTPPRHRHWRTVEQMKQIGLSKGQIQRELLQQLRGDPSPWEPLPPRPERPPRQRGITPG